MGAPYGTSVEWRDGSKERVEALERDVVGKFVEACGREPLGRLGRVTRSHPSRHSGKALQVIDLAEETVVADERVEHQRRKPRPLVFIRIEVDAQAVIVERSRDDPRGRVDRVQLKRMNVHVPLRRH